MMQYSWDMCQHILNYPAVSAILSGVTTLEQIQEDIEIFSKPGAAVSGGCFDRL
jgi:predicted aldo/keto reductase-like oxidoreductase